MRLGVEHDLAVVGTAESVAPAVRHAMSSPIDVLIFDIDSLGDDDTTGIATFRKAQPTSRIVALSLSDDNQTRRAVAEAGADVLIGKHEPAEALLSAIRASPPPSGGRLGGGPVH